MNFSVTQNIPDSYNAILHKSEEIGFTMPSDIFVGSLLKTLISTKPAGNFLELGTGVGLSLSWMVNGMDTASTITSIDNDGELVAMAADYFKYDKRVRLLCAEGAEWLRNYSGEPFDLIFADAWPGKYDVLDTTLNLLKTGGIYVIDDMKRQPNWPEGHEENVNLLIDYLEQRKDLNLTKLDWSTGIIMAVKTSLR